MWRIRFILIFFAIFYSVLSIRLFYLQIVSGNRYHREATDQRSYEMEIPAVRGSILASDGSPLAMSTDAYLIYTQPSQVTDLNKFTDVVGKILDLDSKYLNDQLKQPGRFWIPLAHRADAVTVENLKNTGISGIGYETESKRFYPEASMSAHVLGFVGYDTAGKDRGYFGLEGFYDRELSGKSGSLNQEMDAQGNPILLADIKRISSKDGRTLVLWTDRIVQRIADVRLAEGIVKYGAKEGTVTVMDPKTGGILAVSAYPSYEPSRYNQYPESLYKNPIIASSYEPGSTFKVLVMAAAVEENAVTPQTEMNENGPVKIGEYTIRTWNDTYRGRINMTDVLVHSSNVGMVFVERQLGQKKLLSYIRGFGFGNPTGIDLEEETSPAIRADGEWQEIDFATSSFGQGIAVTPLQMIRAVAAIANGGMVMEPKVVREIRDQSGRSVPLPPKNIKQIISPKTARIITEMMISAVDNGEAKWAKPKGYRIAGKTGTAQIPVAGHYDEKKTIASFVGFAPADDPKFVILVTLREPASSPWGSETAAPLFFNISKDLFLYYGIAPS